MQYFKHIIGSLALLITLSASAQQGMVMHQLDNVSQSTYLNPAFDTGMKRTVGIPALSSIYVNFKNTFLQPGELFSNSEGQVVFNKDYYLNSLEDFNYLGTNVAIDIVSYQQKIGEVSLFASVRERFSTRLTLPRDFLAFPFTGNANFQDLNNGILDFSGLKVEMMHYREIGFGAQTKLGDKLSIGGRAKILYGYENIDFQKSEIIWKTNELNWDWQISGQIEVNTSGIASDSTASGETGFKDYAFKKKNRGLGIDLGAVYEVSKKLSISAGIIDLGYIKWKDNVETTVTNDASFIYSGLSLAEDVILAGGGASDSIDVAVEQLEQDIKDAFSYTTNNESYKTSLLTQTNIGAKYKVVDSKKFESEIGVLLHTEYYKGEINNSIGISYNQKLGKHFNTVASYSVINKDYKNLGAGFAMTFGKFQFYTAVDNLMALNLTKVKFGADDSGIPIPTYSKNVHVQFGFNLVFADE